MAIALTDERVGVPDLAPIGAKSPAPEPCAALTPRGRAVARLLAFEDVWAELDGADRAYFGSELEQLAREARVER